MVTNGRADMVRNSISCFLSQKYPLKELVILSQGNEDQNREISELAKHPSVMFVEAPSSLSLGSMRNTSVELAHGTIICQWDDDDLYHSDRLMAQYKKLRSRSSATASLYTQHLKYFKDRKKMYGVDCASGTEDYQQLVSREPFRKYLTGSVMFYKWCFHRYRNLFYPEFGHQSDREEDLNVLQKLMHLGEVVPVEEPHYIYVFHGNNTYELWHHEMGLHKKKIFTKDELESSQSFLVEMFKNTGIQGPFDVCTSPIVDFDEPGTVLGEEIVFTFES